MRLRSIGTVGSGVTEDPVAITNLSACTSVFSLFKVTSIVSALVNVACPLMTSILFFYIK
jgi:hypothetical protein